MSTAGDEGMGAQSKLLKMNYLPAIDMLKEQSYS